MNPNKRNSAPLPTQPILVWPVTGCLLGVVFLRLLPELPLGHTLFDVLVLNWTWPLVFVTLTYAFWRIGAKRQAKFGEGTFAPGQATTAGLVVALTVFFLLGVWGAEWPLWWWFAVLFILSVAGLSLVVGWFAYSETWRTVFNAAVMASVEKQIRAQPDRFIGEVERRRDGRAATIASLDWLAKKSQSSGPVARWLGAIEGQIRRWVATYDHAWGSPHALAVLEGNYADACHDLRLAVQEWHSSSVEDAVLDDFVSAGECLAVYLTLNWPEDSPVHETATATRFAIFAELILVAIACATPPVQTSFSKQLLGRTPDWLTGLRSATAPGCERFLEVFEWIVLGLSEVGAKLETSAGDDTIGAERELVSRVLVEYYRLADEAFPAPQTDGRELLAQTWLIAASRVDALVRLDAHEAMAELLPETPAVSPTLIATLARIGLAQLWAEVERRTPSRWKAGVAGRARAATESIPAARPQAVQQALSRVRVR